MIDWRYKFGPTFIVMQNNKTNKNWLSKLGLSHPLLIAGPCSAETEAQVLETAHKLKESTATIFRAGIWKPRTRPGNFEGVGAIGLKWLQRAKEETGLLTATEVANPHHVELALQHDVDVLWIGARTTVSPFVVQEIAQAMKGIDNIVLVKNPVNPDLALWEGAFERLYTQNITNLGAIHRGFSAYGKNPYRNNPEWQIPIDFKNRFKEVPLLIDPSHIAGDREKISYLCQKALDLNYDGMMIETHPNPDKAWSDADQQITPEQLKEWMKNLNVRKAEIGFQHSVDILEKLRSKIDIVDDQIMSMLMKRMEITDEIGKWKKENNISILQVERWNQVLARMLRVGQETDLSEEFILRFYKAIHQESIHHQNKIINK